MNRREVVAAWLALGAMSGPLGSMAQQPGKVWRIGFLSQRHVDFLESDFYYGPFRQGMRELGYVEGKNFVIDWRSAEGKAEVLPGLASDLVRSQVDLIVSASTPASLAAQRASSTVPIVMVAGNPVESGLVASLGKPGGNVTGLSAFSMELTPKLLELARAISPNLSVVGVLVNSDNPAHVSGLKSLRSAAEILRVRVVVVNARSSEEIETAFSSNARQNAKVIIVFIDPILGQQRTHIAELAVKHRVSTVSSGRIGAEAGSLIGFGANVGELYRRAATYVDKIIKGAKPGDLPVEQPTKFELVVNLKTAKSLEIKMPQELLLRAERVIE